MPLSTSQEKAFCKLPLVNQFDEIVRVYKTLIDGSCEKEMLLLAKNFESCRKKWNLTELKCAELQEKLTKCEAEKNALMIKLKHARRQIEVEIQHRHQVEQERDELAQQMALVRELLLSDSSPSPTLTEEQQKKLDFLNSTKFRSPRGRARTHRRLEPIDETGSLLSDYSDISFDYTEDDLDCTQLRNGKRYKRSRVGIQPLRDEEETLPKKVRADIAANESLLCTVDGPATMHIEKLEKSFSRPNPHQGRRRPSREHRRKSASSDSELLSEVENFWPSAMHPSARQPVLPTSVQHKLLIKPCVITKETCKPCGKRIQFGKKALKCSECRLITHLECEERAKNFSCDLVPNSPLRKNNLDNFLVSDESLQIPPIIYHTVQEIERRGLKEVGLYRIPGMIKIVKDLKEKFQGKHVPKLTEVNDVHALCSLVKDFLRVTLNEPLLTFDLRPKFIAAAQNVNDSQMFNVISELKDSNRDTLMFLLLHFQRVVNSEVTRMSIEALAKAVGPSLVGYSSAEPSVSEIQTAAKYQELVMTKLLELPAEYYSNGLEIALQKGAASSKPGLEPSTPETYKQPASMLGPIGSPRKTPSSSSLAERAKRYLGGTPFGKGKSKETSYFASPSLK